MKAFEMSSNKGELSLNHLEYGVRLEKWSGSLHYRIQGKVYTYDIDFSTIKGTGDKKTITIDGTHLEVELNFTSGDIVKIEASLKNISVEAVKLDKLSLIINGFSLGGYNDRYSFFKNGYQSWTVTHTFFPKEKGMVSILPPMNNMQDNLRNLPSKRRGEFTSDMFSVIGNLDRKIYLLIGQGGSFSQFVYIGCNFPNLSDKSTVLALVYDFGGKVLPSGSEIDLDEVILIADNHSNRVQDRYFDLIMPKIDSQDLPTGWCSWYYYFTKISQDDLYDNLSSAREKGVNWNYFVLDDGYQTAVGDWLSINRKFPDELKAVSERINASGMTPGLWLAPFIARRNSALFKEQYEWVLKDENGKPALAGWNPNWGIGGSFYGLDVTHPGFQDYLRQVIGTIVHEWGFKYLKLDFVYGASLFSVAYDPILSSAERIRLGYRIIREAAGKNVFILGCGSPMSASIGLVDAMRIGPDVSPYWHAKYRYHLTRDPHALCTKFAIRSILNRCQMHRKLWLNDPDCLLIRDTNTRLTEEERMSLANAIIVTGGMYLISDKLSALSPEIWELIEGIDKMVRLCDTGRAWALDYMEREIPELVYNSKGYLAVFNFENRTIHKKIPFRIYLEDIFDENTKLKDVWDGGDFSVTEGAIDIGEMKPHSSRLLKVE